MYRDVEQILTRELRQVADEVEVPAMPVLPSDPPSRFSWMPTLIAAAVVVLVIGVLATVLTLDGERRWQPAPSPTPTRVEESVSRAAPSVPYVLGGRLFVAGEQVPGQWSSVDGVDSGWVGTRADNTYWWGFDAEPRPIEAEMSQPPVISPDGRYVAEVIVEKGQGMLSGFDTRPAGEGLGGVEVPALMQGIYSRAVAVTDDGLVVGRGADYQEVWRPLVGGGVGQMGDTAPGQVVLGNTAAGLVVIQGRYDSADGSQGSPYLADLAEDGTLTKTADLPTHVVLVASEQWVAWIEPGAIGGETLTVERLQVQRIDGSAAAELTPPQGYTFRAAGLVWEDEDHLVVAVLHSSGGERMVRCSPTMQECVLLDTP
jgi:hypothetical protein